MHKDVLSQADILIAMKSPRSRRELRAFEQTLFYGDICRMSPAHIAIDERVARDRPEKWQLFHKDYDIFWTGRR